MNYRLVTTLYSISLLLLGLLACFFTPTDCFARSNNLETGVSISYDYNDRDFKQFYSEEDELTAQEYDEYNKITIQPLINITSESAKNTIEFSYKPSLKYDFNESETDYFNNLYAGFDHFLSKKLQISTSNHLYHSDYYNQESEATTISDDDSSSLEESFDDTQSDDDLSSDRGRQKYWKNNLNVGSNYKYGKSHRNILDLSLSYMLLRNDDEDTENQEDYDRYQAKFANTHLISDNWKSTSSLAYIRGEFEKEEGDQETEDDDEDLTRSSDEYKFHLSLTNTSNKRASVSFLYDLSSSRYDGGDDQDTDIHDLQLKWESSINRQTKTVVGIGPTYIETEFEDEKEEELGANGTIQITYKGKFTTFSFGIDKGYDIENFSGVDESGSIDYWRSQLSASQEITPSVSATCQLSYNYIDRQKVADTQESPDDPLILEEYNEKTFSAKIGTELEFKKDYTFSFSYTYLHKDSDTEEDCYEDHRFLLTLRYQKDLLHW